MEMVRSPLASFRSRLMRFLLLVIVVVVELGWLVLLLRDLDLTRWPK